MHLQEESAHSLKPDNGVKNFFGGDLQTFDDAFLQFIVLQLRSIFFLVIMEVVVQEPVNQSALLIVSSTSVAKAFMHEQPDTFYPG